MRHLITLADLTTAEIEQIFSISKQLKRECRDGKREPLLSGRVMAMLFEKPSLRTRASFEAAMTHLGGNSIFLGGEAGFGRRESVADFARSLSGYADVVVVRAGSHQTAVDLAEHCTCPVINGLTDFGHPCQALTDLFTIGESTGNLAGQTLAWIGDANNVARSIAVGCGKLGVRMVMATPEKYRFDEQSLAWIRRQAPDLELVVTDDPARAVRDASAIYTDVWASMGQEVENESRRREFAPFQVNAALIERALPNAIFMHCLPAHRGEEVTDEVIDGPRSVVFEQSANRMHVQKGVLAWMLGAKLE